MSEYREKGFPLHPHSQKYLSQGHYWVTSDKFSANFPPKTGLIASLDNKNGQKWILLNDPIHPEVKARKWGDYSNSKIKKTNFWKDFEYRLIDSIEYRTKQHLHKERDNYFLAFGEADELPGLFIQKVGRVILTQIYCGYWRSQDKVLAKTIQRICQDRFPDEKLEYLFQSRNKQTQLEVNHLDYKGKLHKLQNNIKLIIQEFGLNYHLEFGKWYDFGIYSDMSSIRKKITKEWKEGETTLNLFSYTGAFSTQALKSGHSEVHSVDLSPQYMDRLEKNIQENNLDLSKHVPHVASVSKVLNKLKKENIKFDHIICDPPSASSDGKKVSSALKSYDELIPAIAKLLKDDGQAYLFLNTHQVSWKKFEEKINHSISKISSIEIAKRYNLSEDCRRRKGFPEGDYLKGLMIKKTNADSL